jgi:hypothetical protein
MVNHHPNIEFNGDSREILIYGEVPQIEWIYSRWKDWVLRDLNAKYLPAFTVINGETQTYIIDNGWRILSIS